MINYTVSGMNSDIEQICQVIRVTGQKDDGGLFDSSLAYLVFKEWNNLELRHLRLGCCQAHIGSVRASDWN
jgi:hypothetical protein